MQTNPPKGEELDGNLIAPRLDKLARIRELGLSPYPDQFAQTHTLKEVVTFNPEAPDTPTKFAASGRLMRINHMGKSSFAHIQDDGHRLQLYFQKDTLGEESYSQFVDLFDLGDFLGAEGKLFKTRTGELTLRVEQYLMLSKSLRPLPEKYHGLQDPETRYRQRYLDLISNKNTRNIFVARTKVVSAMRHFLDSSGFIEVETPTLQPLYGGASAEPFTTRYRVLDRDFYLRISDELYLKRLVIGGLDRVYEICKDFRNEGIDRTHSPEFTMMECYQAYSNYLDMMDLTERLVAHIAVHVNGTTSAAFGDNELNFNPPWNRLDFRESILNTVGIDLDDFIEAKQLASESLKAGVKTNPELGLAKVQDQLFEATVVPTLIQPTFVHDFPLSMSPLAKELSDKPGYAARFEPYAGKMEFGNAFSELNDPQEQRRRFLMQAEAIKLGDAEAQQLDEDFIRAMEHGMPPTGGLGIGIDRLVMLLTGNQNIREVILFPSLRTLE